MAKPAVLREVMVTLRMAPEMEVEASEKASAVARSMEMSQDKIDEVRMAVIEACLNACEHSRAERKEIEMILSVLGEKQPEKLQITVRDGGVGFDPEGRDGKRTRRVALKKRGWGLQIIEGLMDEVVVDSNADGHSAVVMSKRCTLNPYPFSSQVDVQLLQ